MFAPLGDAGSGVEASVRRYGLLSNLASSAPSYSSSFSAANGRFPEPRIAVCHCRTRLPRWTGVIGSIVTDENPSPSSHRVSAAAGREVTMTRISG
ncbi:hypothetical protein AB0F88_22415 [Streptosporangium sp. NPDC023963]|uniref:hypothetical protein n=1 Tax=Streptosporangium sp. NPDC023963 TaxID=3155608 RepID=UPI00344229BB